MIEKDLRFAYFDTVESLYDIPREHIPLAGTCIDLGAHIGAFSILMAERTDCIIQAYEPFPSNCQTFRDLVTERNLTSRIMVFEEALAETEGQIPLYIDPGPWGEAHTIYGRHSDSVTVKTVSPATIFSRVKTEIAYLKANCQGGEYPLVKFLIRNPSDFLRIKRICLEIHPAELGEERMGALQDAMPLLISLCSYYRIPLRIRFARHSPEQFAPEFRKELEVDTF